MEDAVPDVDLDLDLDFEPDDSAAAAAAAAAGAGSSEDAAFESEAAFRPRLETMGGSTLVQAPPANCTVAAATDI